MANLSCVRVNNMNRAIWEYIKNTANRQDQSIADFIADLVKLHATVTKNQSRLKMMSEIYDDSGKANVSLKLNPKTK